MKIVSKLLTIAFILIVFTSCATTFYQVYQATPSENFEVKNNFLIYEDDNCKVLYDLWDVGGNIGFIFYNKTDRNIYLELDESFFILNGIAYDYFKNRVYTSSTSAGATNLHSISASKSIAGLNSGDLLQSNKIQSSGSVGLITSAGYSISYNEKNEVCIPSLTSKIITEYNINESLYRDCDLFKYPTKDKINTKTFSKTDSPIVFSNRIAYIIEGSNIMTRFENEFYVSEITNYPESEMFESRYDEFCGQRSLSETKYFKANAPNKFYIKYLKEQDFLKH